MSVPITCISCGADFDAHKEPIICKKCRGEMWDRIRRSLEEAGCPIDPMRAIEWNKLHESPIATMLISELDRLSRTDLPKETIDTIGYAITLAFAIGKRRVKRRRTRRT